MYFASEQVHAYMNLVQHYKTLETFTSEVKVAPLTYFEELLIRNRAMYSIVIRVHHICCIFNIVVLCKTAPLIRAEKHHSSPYFLLVIL